MSTLAEAAATFVAILAGFYTTKIFTLKTDKNRVEYKLKQLTLEIEHRKNVASTLRIHVDERQEEKDNDIINYFVKNMAKARLMFDIPVNTYDDVIKLWKKYWNTESEPSETIAKKLKDRSASLIDDLKVKAAEELRKLTDRNYTYVEALPSLRDDTSRIIEADYKREEERKFDQIKNKYNYELNEINQLEKQLDLAVRELSSITYPKYIVFGFSSFALFAFLGVIMPLTSKLWYSYVKEYLYLDPDFFAITLFLTGLIVTLAYIGIETFSIFFIKKKNPEKELKKN